MSALPTVYIYIYVYPSTIDAKASPTVVEEETVVTHARVGDLSLRIAGLLTNMPPIA